MCLVKVLPQHGLQRDSPQWWRGGDNILIKNQDEINLVDMWMNFLQEVYASDCQCNNAAFPFYILSSPTQDLKQNKNLPSEL